MGKGKPKREAKPNALPHTKGKRARANKGILPVLPEGWNKFQFKAPEAQRLCERHARKMANRPTAGMYREAEEKAAGSLYFATASREQDMGHPMADRRSMGPCPVGCPSRYLVGED